jgi:NAD(P)-dependent dehydrogenase (short-subunit alcohol dehydrogenase family)
MAPDGVAVVTGGASGIGLGLARAFATRYERVVVADLDENALGAAVDELTLAGAKACGVRTDVTDAASVGALAERAFGLGPVRAVCMNAGVTTTGRATWASTPEQLNFVMGVNFLGLVHSVAAFVPGLIDQGGESSVIVTASMAGMVASGSSGPYAASKAAAVAYTKALAAELESAAPDVSVVLLIPGMVATNLMRTSALHAAAHMEPDRAEVSHRFLNDLGATPAEVASWVLEAADAHRFWAVPPPEDTFSTLLVAELEELLAVLTRTHG